MKRTAFGLAALAALLGSTAYAETNWKMATKMPVDSPEGQVFQKFAELTEEYTGGELKITVYPNEQLGKENAVLEQLQANIIQIYAEGYSYMKKWEPALDWTTPAFAFDDYDHWVRFMNSDTVKGWFDNAAAQSGVRPLGDPTRVLRGPFRVTVSNVPIETADDYNGLKLRMHESKSAIETWDAIAAHQHCLITRWCDVLARSSRSHQALAQRLIHHWRSLLAGFQTKPTTAFLPGDYCSVERLSTRSPIPPKRRLITVAVSLFALNSRLRIRTCDSPTTIRASNSK